MSEPKTPNLGLNKIDRSSPSTTYFDLDKYLDQNWEKIDDFAEKIGEQAEETATKVSSLQERLDTDKRGAATLQPGVNVVSANQEATFNLSSIKGRTLVNLLGRAGGCEQASLVNSYQSTITADTSNKVQGNQSLKITTTATPAGALSISPINLKSGKYYIVLSSAKLISGELVGMYLNELNPNKGNVTSSNSKRFSTLWGAYSISTDISTFFVSQVVGASGSSGYIDAIRLYEISASEYVALENMTTEQIARNYPYVDSVQPVLNPYAIRYGQNLLPPFYEWSETAIAGPSEIEAPYQLKMTKASGTVGFSNFICTVNVAPSTAYTFSTTVDVTNFGGNGVAGVYWNGWYYDEDDNAITSFNKPPYAKANGKFTLGNIFKTPDNAKSVRIVIGFDSETTGTAIFKNPCLNLGTSAMTFKPREDSFLALQTELHANPDTGENPDSVFERDGQYYKLAKWRKVTLGPDINFSLWGGQNGFKVVNAMLPGPPAVDGSGTLTKYQGKVIKETDFVTVNSATDNLNIGSSGANGVFDNFQISISSADSGWGDSYTNLTSDEIKAYFMGYFMYTAGQDPNNNGAGYNGSGTKVWTPLLSKNSQNFFTKVPTVPAPNWTSYQLLYQLAKPIVEPITSEGQLTFIDGDNQIEVGTGIVLREVAPTPIRDGYGRWNIGNIYAGPGAQDFKNKSKLVLNVYKNGKLDPMWFKFSAAQESILGVSYDPTATYSVTYLMLDKYPAVDITGTYAKNEKALLLDTVKTLQENTTRISVLESKKAEKDNPAWITPTLLNGWINYSAAYQPPGYYKDSQGVVHLRGLISSGTSGTGTFIFNLPVGYRPKRAILFNTLTSNGTTLVVATLEIASNGVVYLGFAGGNTWLNLENISFLAEQ
ncbi:MULTISPECIES: hypothetical protein [Paenibacillus]|uniref:Tail fiber protein n=1 Tax=Paenibacillus cucumis (ex Kampfer et al. 2016) TaxID=1776858 RepID=A0ABS7KFU7_9BACL|nr:hypothetical protein [Paenibacillus cucumis (ex Kampfer et al. 2016)]MBY0202986.1 hypothetical protein [Paenibacillus cucumis (ex Kampfer et al. 2016)]MDP9700608.1 hypothetical protein [Paenibacillus intestini]